MQPDDASISEPSATQNGREYDEPREKISESARGWHRIQLAVLGFIGLCGVLWGDGDNAAPEPLQWLAIALVVVALVLACVAIYLVGRVAHPFSGAPAERSEPAAASRRLRTGVLITYLAVGILVVATLTGWWPSATATSGVEVRDAAGETWCGELTAAPDGAVRLDTDSGAVTLGLDGIRSISPADRC